ncbi:MAG TPA: Tim44/TimA family putative adaptor protein [Stellaceae bacterium]|jgi:predicted lipid-binding transport protein (Tim44 family)|nr:Tim44/TimA family putative adaptor protein [Stellaceae bacterium]
MGDLPHYFDIILFAMVALFLVLRLRSVLGRRTGNERRRTLFARNPVQNGEQGGPDKIVSLTPRRNPAPLVADAPPANTVAGGVAQITAADPGFETPHFLDGVRGAFQIIVGAFAKGDKAALRPLLSDDTYRSFAAAIDEREAAGETLETRIDKLKDIDIFEAGMDARLARVTVKLISDQINVLRAHDGSVVDGDPQHLIEKTDFWTFSRDTRSSDPNWLLVATGSG